MSARIDMPTNEGTLALARSVATGAKLVISGVMLCKTQGALGTVADVAGATWGPSENGFDLSDPAYRVTETPIQCTSYLPSLVDMSGDDTGKPVVALDMEFTWMPTLVAEYDTLAVLAEMYYEFAPFHTGSDYRTGATVWYLRNNGEYEYYRCIADVTNSVYPANDPAHWESVTPGEPTDKIVSQRDIQYRSIGDRPVLLYVSVASNVITVSPELEIDYKVRLYLECNATDMANTADPDAYVKKYIVFDTLGPEFMGSAQLALLAQFATQLRYVRDIAMEKVQRG